MSHETGTTIPSFLSARSPQGLRRLMLRNNTKHGMFFKYFDIQFVDGRWFAWFFLNLQSTNSMKEPEEIVEGDE